MRREMPQADTLIDRSHEIYGPLGWTFQKVDRQWTAPNGAILRFRPLEDDRDAEKYQGQAFSRVYLEELTNWPSSRAPDKMKATLRSAAGVPVGFRATANPGGVGHLWVKQRYIDPHPMGMRPLPDETGKLERIFIPARVHHNRILLSKDPLYEERLRLSGSKELVKAWLEGDWSVIEGAFFDCWDSAKHVIRPFTIPDHWLRFRSMDWGSAAPFSVGWWAVVSDTHDLEGVLLPRGALIRYREWYGASGPNTGLKLTAEQVAQGIAQRETQGEVTFGVLDPAAFAQDGGPSIAERMQRAYPGCNFRPADNKRVKTVGAMGGWDQLRDRLVGDDDGKPMLYVFATCNDVIRTLPALQHDPDRPEDVDCWVAGTQVSTPDGPRPIEGLRFGDIVDTPIGPRPVLRSYLSGPSETISITLEDGRELRGTPHHKVYARGKGLVALENLQCHDVLEEKNSAWQRRLLSIAASFIRDTKAASITIRTAPSLRMAELAFIDKFGWTPVGRFPRAGISTTRTMTTTTIDLRTLNVFRQALMGDIISKSGWPASSGRSSMHGASLTRAKQFFGIMPVRCAPEHHYGHFRALIVESLLRRDMVRSAIARAIATKRRTLRAAFESFASFVGRSSSPSVTRPKKLEPARIVAVGRCEELTPVYNLTVADAHLFYANGLLSSNTDGEDHAPDETRYACMARPWIKPPPKQPKPMTTLKDVTYDELWKAQQKRSGRI